MKYWIAAYTQLREDSRTLDVRGYDHGFMRK